MCLAVPGKLINKQGDEAIASMHGTSVRVSTVLVPEAQEGDWVLVHAGFAIQRLNEAEAQETFALIQQMNDAAEKSDASNAGSTPSTAGQDGDK